MAIPTTKCWHHFQVILQRTPTNLNQSSTLLPPGGGNHRCHLVVVRKVSAIGACSNNNNHHHFVPKRRRKPKSDIAPSIGSQFALTHIIPSASSFTNVAPELRSWEQTEPNPISLLRYLGRRNRFPVSVFPVLCHEEQIYKNNNVIPSSQFSLSVVTKSIVHSHIEQQQQLVPPSIAKCPNSGSTLSHRCSNGLKSNLPFQLFSLSRRCFTSSSSDGSTGSQSPLSISFIEGYFKLYLDTTEFIFHYWTPVAVVRQSLEQHLSSTSENGSNPAIVQFEHQIEFENGTENSSIDGSTAQQPQYYRLSESMPFGYAFTVLDPGKIRLISRTTGQVYQFNFAINPRKSNQKFGDDEDSDEAQRKLCLGRIQLWSQQNPIQPLGPSSKEYTKSGTSSLDSHELLFLEHERQSIQARFAPLERDFNRMVQIAKTEAHIRFKWGGLFLLSAQMGFVARLTWFEYSWDIMEPVTWFLTYVMMVGTFAYYLVTSQEYLVPMVEKRIILSRFWKLVRSSNFDVLQYRTLRDELSDVEQRIQCIRQSLSTGPLGPSSSSSYSNRVSALVDQDLK